MQFTASLLAVLCTISVASAAPSDNSGWPGKGKGGDYYSLGCPKTTKPWASSDEQLKAVTTYYTELFSGKVDTAFDTWVAKDFINHAPEVKGDGTANAKAAVTGLLAQSKEEIYNIFVGKNASSADFANVYFKGINSRGVGAIMEYWRFAGNCLVEHWNVAEEASGNFSNPKAFF